MDFSGLVLKEQPNQYLVCPPGLCELAVPHREAPVYPVSLQRLRQAWFKMVAHEARVQPVRVDEAAVQYDYVQYTPLLHMPDRITVRFMPWGDGQSTLAVYSRSVYGSMDFGVNESRVTSWLEALDAEIARLD